MIISYETNTDGEQVLVTTLPSGAQIRTLNRAPAPVVNTKLTRLAFRNRFTGAEKVAIYTAATTTPQLRIYLDDLMSVDYIDLSNADTIAGVNALATAGIITGARATSILTEPVTASESA